MKKNLRFPFTFALVLSTFSFSMESLASLRQKALQELNSTSKKNAVQKKSVDLGTQSSEIVNVNQTQVSDLAQDKTAEKGVWYLKISSLQNRGSLRTDSFGSVNLSFLPTTVSLEMDYQWSPLRQFQFQDRSWRMGFATGWLYNQQSSDVRSPQGSMQDSFTVHHSILSTTAFLSTRWGRKDLWTLQSGVLAGFDFYYQTSTHPELQKAAVLGFLGIQASALYQSASGIKIGPSLQLRTLAGIAPLEIGIQGSLPW
jgi:hypothetical protein